MTLWREGRLDWRGLVAVKTVVESSITIDGSPERVASLVLDPDVAPLWNSGLERFEVLSKTPELVGSKARLHYVEGGRRYVMEDVLLEVEPARRFLSRVSGETLEAEVETLLVPIEGGTRVVVRWSGRGKRLILRVLLPLMQRSIARRTLADLEKLKRLVEAD
jgi:uncharacterized protein YndB with AHSA1/START domain